MPLKTVDYLYSFTAWMLPLMEEIQMV